MGQDFGFIGAVTVPTKNLAAYRAAEVDPSKMKGWPEAFGEPDDPEDADYSETVEDVLAECNELEVTWRKDGVDIRGLATDDGDTWLTYRILLVASVRLAAKHGGSGELVIASWAGDDEAWKAVSTPDGKSSFKALKGKELKDALKQVAEAELPRG